MKGQGLVVVVAVAFLVIAVAQTVILYRYTGLRDAVISDAERTVVRAQLDTDEEKP